MGVKSRLEMTCRASRCPFQVADVDSGSSCWDELLGLLAITPEQASLLCTSQFGAVAVAFGKSLYWGYAVHMLLCMLMSRHLPDVVMCGLVVASCERSSR